MPVMSDGKVQVGADRLEEWLADLDGCRVALAVNQTSLLSASSVHLVDTLLARGINVVALFAPEHGLRGTADAGEILSDSRDARTGLPIYSLYGMNKKPSGRQLKDIDVLISTFRMSVLVLYLYFHHVLSHAGMCRAGCIHVGPRPAESLRLCRWSGA